MNSLQDKYSYLRDPQWPVDVTDPNILTFLKQENENLEKFLFSQKNCNLHSIEMIFNEIKQHISLHDFKPSIINNSDYEYYEEISKSDDYWKYFRKHIGNQQMELILDVNEIAKGHEFCTVTSVKPSPDNSLLAYALNIEGGEDYTIIIKSLTSGLIIDQQVSNVFSDFIWHKDSKSIYYIPCGENWRAQQVKRHIIESNTIDDILIYDEKDSVYWVEMYVSLSHRFLFISPKTGEASEIHFIDLDVDSNTTTLLKSRNDRHICKVSHYEDSFYILINDQGKNFRLIQTCINNPWNEVIELIPHSKDIYLEDIDCYANFFMVFVNENGFAKIHVKSYSLNSLLYSVDYSKHSQKGSYDSHPIQLDFHTNCIRYDYSSLNTPLQIWEYSLLTKELICLKQTQLEGFNSNDYIIDRIYAPYQILLDDKAYYHDDDANISIPISIIYKNDLFNQDGTNPLLLYGYGSYGYANPAKFRATIFPLLNRGFVFAIAHIRGGSDLGFYWYESAKFLTKKKTFYDFILCAKYLIQEKYSSQGNLVCEGRSAGGMLVGYVINEQPHLFKTAILGVPFVDVINTMLDETLPLTTTEFEEWGNPKDPIYYDYMLSYSPYDNVKVQEYPCIFMTAGIRDPRVGYWEPAKYLAKLKELKIDNNPCHLKTNMVAGHFGKTSRYEAYKEYAEQYGFVLKTFGFTD